LSQATAAQPTREQGKERHFEAHSPLNPTAETVTQRQPLRIERHAPQKLMYLKLRRPAVESRGQMVSTLTRISGGTHLIIKSSIKIDF